MSRQHLPPGKTAMVFGITVPLSLQVARGALETVHIGGRAVRVTVGKIEV